MSTWKQARKIATFELSRNGITPLLLIVFAGILFVVYASDPVIYQEIYVDFVFLALFSGSFIMFARAGAFKTYEMDKQRMAFSVVFLQQFPVSKQAVFYSRIIIHNVYNVFGQSLFIIPYYAFIPAFRETMPIYSFIAFYIMWISIGIFSSGFLAAEDAGKSMTQRDRSATIRLICQLVFAVAFLLWIYMYTPYTIISGSIEIAKHWPILASFIAFSFSIIGIYYGKRKTIRILQTTDYT